LGPDAAVVDQHLQQRPQPHLLGVSHWGDPAYGYRNGPNSSNLPTVPFGRWFELRADVHPDNRIDFYLDGQALRERPPERILPSA
jgi:hypothetical protein